MDFSPSALLSPIIMADDDDNYIFSGIDDQFLDIYQPNQYQQITFTDQIMKEMMEDDENNLAVEFESGVENVISQISVPSATAADSSASPDFFSCNYELTPSPASLDFLSMILQEPQNDIAAVDDGGNSDVSNKRSRSMLRNKSQIKEHILSERKRREKLRKLFIALAAMVPGLKKTDKGSILEATIDYLKQLKLREHLLNEEMYKKKSNKLHIQTKTSSSSSCKSFISSDSPFNSIKDILDIEVKYEGKNILIRIKYKSRKKGVIVNLLREIEVIGLTIHNCCVIPFDDSYLVITIIVEVNALFSLTKIELETKLHCLIRNQLSSISLQDNAI